MGLTKIKITDRIGWFEKLKWIHENFEDPQDNTNWAGWQLGLNDIEFIVREKDAIIYYLKWSECL